LFWGYYWWYCCDWSWLDGAFFYELKTCYNEDIIFIDVVNTAFSDLDDGVCSELASKLSGDLQSEAGRGEEER